MRLPAALVDREPRTRDEELRKLRLIFRQTQQAMRADEHLVDCPCGVRRRISLMYRCAICGVWLCEPCAFRHLDIERHGPLNRRRRRTSS